MIPRNDQASVRQHAHAHSVRHMAGESRESSWAAQGRGREGDQQPQGGLGRLLQTQSGPSSRRTALHILVSPVRMPGC